MPPDGVDVFLGPDLPAIKVGSGPRTLVLLPGLSLFPGHPTGQARSRAMMGWEPFYDRYTVYRIGRRVRPVGTDFQDMADDVIAAIEGIGPPVDLVGGSTGGVIALHVAAARPDLVRRLVLIVTGTAASAVLGPRLGGVSSDVRAGRWRRVYSQIFRLGARSRLERLAYGALGWVMGPRLVGIPDDPTIMLAELDAWVRVDAGDLVTRVICPTLVVAGELDPIFPLTEARHLADKLTDGTLAVMPRVAHDVPVSAITAHIVPFLADPGPSR